MNNRFRKEIDQIDQRITQLKKRTQAPQNLVTRVYNDSGAQIDAGDVVYISGVDTGRPEIGLASNAAAATYDSLVGVVAYDIADTEAGYVIRYGYVRDIDTSAWAAADELYLVAAGALTNVKPVAPAVAIYIGSVITVGASDGVIFVNPGGSGTSGGGAGGGGWENITLWHSGTFTEFAFTEAGLIAANAAAVAGDLVFIAGGTITLTAAITIGNGVAWKGWDSKQTILTCTADIDNLITSGDTSSIMDMTIIFHCQSNSATTRCLFVDKTILKNLYIEMYEEAASATTYAIDGDMYYSGTDGQLAAENVNVYVEGTDETTNATNLRGIYLDLEDASSKARVSNLTAYLTNVSSSDMYGMNFDSVATSRVYADNCVVLIENNYDSGYQFGIYAEYATMNDCYVYIVSDVGIGATGIYVDRESRLTGCGAYLEGNNEDGTQDYVAIWGYTDSEFFGCWGIVEDDGAPNSSYGYIGQGSDTTWIYNCVFRGSTYDILVGNNGVLNINSCQYDTVGGDGQVVGQSGDLSGIGVNLWDSTGNVIGRYAFTEAGLTAALAAASTGDIVRIPAGTITLTAAISVPAGVELKGMSRYRSILSAAGNLGTQPITLTTGSKLSNLTFNFDDQRGLAGNTRVIDCNASYVENVILNITSTNAGGGIVGIDMINAIGLILKDVDVSITSIDKDIGVLQGVNVTANTNDDEFSIDGLKIYMEIDFDTDCEGFTIWADASNPATVKNLDVYMICSADNANVLGINNPSYTDFYLCKSHVESASGYDCYLYALDNDNYPGNNFYRCDFITTFTGAGGSGEGYPVFNDQTAYFEFCKFHCDGTTYDSPWGMVGFWADATTYIKNSIIEPASGYDLLVNAGTTYVANLAYDPSNSNVIGTLVCLPGDKASICADNTFTGNITIEGTLTTESGRIVNTTRVVAVYTILITDHVVFCNTDAGAYTATLPAGAEGQTFRIINSGSSGNDLSVAPDGAEHLIGVNASIALSDGEALLLSYSAVDGWL